MTEGMAVQEEPNRWQPWILSILLALLPLSFSISLRVKVLPPAILFLIGTALIVRYRDTRDCYRRARLVTIAIALLLVSDIVNVLGHRLGWHPLDHAAHILLYLTIAAAFSRPLQMKLVWAGFSVTAIAFGAICLVQHHVLGIDRAHSLNGGASSAIEFAMIMLGLALIALIQLLFTRASTGERLLHGAGMLFGMYGALLTQSRGPLLAFVPVFLAVIMLQAIRTNRWRLSLLMVVVACAGAVVATTTLRTKIIDRFTAIDQVLSDDNPVAGTDQAINERLHLWHAAERAIKAHPWTGIGINQFDVFIRKDAEARHSDPSITRFNHPHNQYLEAAANGGIPGLFFLLLAFLLPLFYFARHLRHREETVTVAAITGSALIGLYMLCAITDSVFYRVMSQSLYFFLVPGCAILIARELQRIESSGRNA